MIKMSNTDKTSPSLKEQIYASILNNITLGVYQPDQLLNEKSLMEQFHVSRAPIREALVELCNERILYSIPYRGYRITPLSAKDIADVKAWRCVTECDFMRQYWHKFTDEALARLEKINEMHVQGRHEHDAVTHWNINSQFHLSLFGIYGNDYAYQLLASALSYQARAYVQTRWEEFHSHNFQDIPVLHTSLLQAIRADEKENAAALLRADIYSI